MTSDRISLPTEGDHQRGVTFFQVHQLLIDRRTLYSEMVRVARDFAAESTFVTRMAVRAVNEDLYWIGFNTRAFEAPFEELVGICFRAGDTARALRVAGYRFKVMEVQGGRRLRFSSRLPDGDPNPQLKPILTADIAWELYEEGQRRQSKSGRVADVCVEARSGLRGGVDFGGLKSRAVERVSGLGSRLGGRLRPGGRQPESKEDES